jgi:hypothetical protein
MPDKQGIFETRGVPIGIANRLIRPNSEFL